MFKSPIMYISSQPFCLNISNVSVMSAKNLLFKLLSLFKLGDLYSLPPPPWRNGKVLTFFWAAGLGKILLEVVQLGDLRNLAKKKIKNMGNLGSLRRQIHVFTVCQTVKQKSQKSEELAIWNSENTP